MKLIKRGLFMLIIACSVAACAVDNKPALQKSAAVSPSTNRSIIPDSVANSVSFQRPKQIALLLPLEGQYKNYAKAVENGFLAAYYDAKNSGQPVPKVVVLDTTNKNIREVYQTAVSEGADIVVGPLAKPDVAALVSSGSLSVPTLALNSLDNGHTVKNLYQFGLSPLDEAKQAAEKARQDGKQNVIVIAPGTAWGRSVAAAFIQKWQSLGGNVVGQSYYAGQQSIAQNISQALNVSTSDQQAKDLRRILGQRFRYLPRRREDIDAIFLVSDPYYARQIRPMLQYYFAGNLPVYATSQVYSGTPSPTRDRDLDGIIFPDMPWVLSENQMSPQALDRIQQQAKSTWPDSYRQNPKLYALGTDAYDVATILNRMVMLPQYGTPAATGVLYLDPNQQIYRQLQWSRIQNGIPQRISQ